MPTSAAALRCAPRRPLRRGARRPLGRPALGLALAVLLAPAAARSQGAMGHPLPPALRPLHVLLARSDAVAIGTIDAVDGGRIRVRGAVAVVGDPGGSFELKRAPSNPPSFAPGARALLLLRGARSPYVLAEEPRESVLFASEEAEARWRAALPELHAALRDPVRLRDVYLAWADGADDGLREQALRGLYDAEAPFQPLPPELTRERARMALDPARAPGSRRASAAIAVLDPAGAAALVAAVPGAVPEPDPVRAEVYEIALQGGLMRRNEVGTVAAIRRGLAASDTGVRRVAARWGAQLSLPDVRAAVAKLAGDPDPEVRRIAEKAAAGS